MTDRVEELAAKVREFFGDCDCRSVGMAEHDAYQRNGDRAETALSELQALAERATRLETELDAANDILQEFVDAWFEWEPGDDTEPLDRTAGRAMARLGTTLTLAAEEGGRT